MDEMDEEKALIVVEKIVGDLELALCGLAQAVGKGDILSGRLSRRAWELGRKIITCRDRLIGL